MDPHAGARPLGSLPVDFVVGEARLVDRDTVLARWPLVPGRYLVGRAPECDLQVPDGQRHVSRVHLELLVSAGRVVATDLGSHNGIRFGSGRVEGSVVIPPGERLQLGPSIALEFSLFPVH